MKKLMASNAQLVRFLQLYGRMADAAELNWAIWQGQ